MNESALMLAIPAGIALVWKLLYLFRLKIKTRIDRSFTVLCLTMVFQNASEFCGYMLSGISIVQGIIVVDYYMFATYLMLAAILNFSLSIINYQNKKVTLVIFSIPLALIILHAGGLIVDRWQVIGDYTVMSVPSEYYFLFRLFLLGSVSTSLYLLYKHRELASAKISLIGLIPLCLVLSIVVSLKLIGVSISTGIVLPFCTLAFLIAANFSTKEDIMDIADLAKIRLRMVHNLLFNSNKYSHDELMDSYQLTLYVRAYKKCNGVQADMAELLKTSPSTVTRMLKKHNLENVKGDNGQQTLKLKKVSVDASVQSIGSVKSSK